MSAWCWMLRYKAPLFIGRLLEKKTNAKGITITVQMSTDHVAG